MQARMFNAEQHLESAKERVFNAEQHLQRAGNKLGSQLSALSAGWAPLSATPKSTLNPEVKAWVPGVRVWVPSAAAKCFACKGAGEVSSPFNPEETVVCECKK